MQVINLSSFDRSRWIKKPIGSQRYHHWLIDSGSLTQRLQTACPVFSIMKIRQRSGKPAADETATLRLKPCQHAMIREVLLRCKGRPVVFAHSVLPFKSLRGPWLGLSHLGNKSLGSALFSDFKVKRTPLEFKKLSRNHALYRQAHAQLETLPHAVWARRSIFSLKQAKIMVTEVFLPQVLDL